MTPLRLTEAGSAAAQMGALGISPREIGTVIVSHFHADHLCGLEDFPEAAFVASAAGFDHARSLRGWGAVSKGFVPSLLPTDFADRLRPLGPLQGPEIDGLGRTEDLFGDGLLRLVALPGHARGQIGLLANTDRGLLFLVADAAWQLDSIRRGIPPHPVTNRLVDQPVEALATLHRLREFARANPEVALIPTHCPEALQRWAELPS